MSDTKQALTRRDFVRGTVGATVAASLLGNPLDMLAATGGTSQVVLARHENALDARHVVDPAALKQIFTQVMTSVTGKKDVTAAWRTLVKPEDVVGLVPTDHLNKTHPELIDLVRSTLQQAGVPEQNIRIAQGGPDKARACTALIAMPALKAHWLTGIGTVLKNYITFSGSPSSYHDSNNAKLGEIWNMPHVKGKTRLVLVDALRPLCDKGPQPDPRYMWEYKGLVAGRDPVAVETVCVQILLKKREALRGEPWPLSPPPVCVERADKDYGLGTSDLAKIRLERLGWSQNVLV
jgi:hypothetical protein